MPVSRARSAGWGAACDPCARAKARCIRSDKSPGGICDRCQSLEKECTKQVHKPRKKRQSNPSKASHSEERLNSLIKSLNHSEQTLAPFGSPPDSGADDALTNNLPMSAPTASPAQHQVNDSDTVANAPSPGFNPFGRPTCTCQVGIGKEYLNAVESDEALLTTYNVQLSSQFPFVMIAQNTTSAQFQQSRPFLFKVIRMVASIRNRRSMWGQSRAVSRHISDAVIMRSERSLDLLQGILVFSGYYHYFCLAHGQFNNLTHSAISMIGDMGSDRCVKPHERPRYSAMDPEEPKARTNEERRAIIGVWYMSSNASSAFNKLGSPQYTKHLDQSLNESEHAAEYETDELLVQSVRIQHSTDRIFQFIHRDQIVDEMPDLVSSETQATTQLFAFQAASEKLHDDVPQRLKSNYLLSSHYATARLRLCEPLLTSTDPSEAAPTSCLPFLSPTPSLPHQAAPNHRHTAATAALRAWFDTWLAIPVCYYFYMPQPGYGHLIYAITMSTRWVRLELSAKYQPSNALAAGARGCGSGDESASNVSSDLMPDLLESLAARFAAAKEEIAAARGGEWKNDFLDQCARQLRVKKARIERWRGILAGDGERGDQANGTVRSGPGESREDFDATLLADLGQDNWLWATDLFDGSDVGQGAWADDRVWGSTALADNGLP